MPTFLNSELSRLKGIGPQRATLLAERGFHTLADLLGYLPFRYEDRIRFTPIAEIVPGQFFTVQAEVTSAATIKFARDRKRMFLMKVRDSSGILSVRFFFGAYLEGRLKPGMRLVLNGRVTMDPFRTSRREMINPEYEILSNATADDEADIDSTEVGRIVPIYEAIGGVNSRMLRRIIYGILRDTANQIPETLPEEIRKRYALPSRREALMYVHFPPANESLELLNSFRSPAHVRMIFEEFFFFQLGIAARRKEERAQAGIPSAGARR